MFAAKLLTSLVVASDCYIVLNMFEHVFTFHISHITWGINYNWVAHLQKLANESLSNGAVVIGIMNNSFIGSEKTLVFWKSRKSSNWNK